MIYLHKFLPALVSPLFLVLVLLGISFLTHKLWPRILAIIILILASNPYIARLGEEILERGSHYRPMTEIQPVDKVIVLSGILVPVPTNNFKIKYEFNGAVDRFEAGLEFMKRGKAEKIVFTRGLLPWSDGLPEGEVLARLAIERGIDSEDILLTERVQNTADEARAVKKLVSKSDRLVLITSAFHMPRALNVFAAQNLNVLPYPVDFHTKAVRTNILDLVPNAGAFSQNSAFIREILGRLYYSLRP